MPTSLQIPVTDYQNNIKQVNINPVEQWLKDFTIANIQYPSNTPTRFWASNEDAAGTSEYIIFDLGASRQANFIDFQICQKPC